MNPKSNIPIFIPSKGRADNGKTWHVMDKMGVDRYRVIVEPQEYDWYCQYVDPAKVIVLDMGMKEIFDPLDGVTYAENARTGSGPARNYGWKLAREMGAPWHWIIDDNIREFYVYNNNVKYKARFDTFAKVEQFVDKYENVGMAGMQYGMFVPRKQKHAPLTINTRIFSCNLIRTDLPLEWRGRYNEDVILSLDILSSNYCTILFNAYLCKKITTQQMKGGNTDELYRDGTEAKSRLLKQTYPQYVELTMKYGRHHHTVNYKHLKNIPLIRKQDG